MRKRVAKHSDGDDVVGVKTVVKMIRDGGAAARVCDGRAASGAAGPGISLCAKSDAGQAIAQSLARCVTKH